MLKKLKLALRIPPFLLLAKTFLIFFLLLSLSIGRLNFYLIFAFVFFAALFYFLPIIRVVDFLGYFLVFLAGALISIVSLEFSLLTILIVLGLSIIYFLLIGLKNLNISSQNSIFLLRALLFLLVFFIFFAVNKSEFFLIKYSLFVLAILLLFFELFRAYPKKKLYTLAFAFLCLEVSWAINLLPIGFFNQSALALVFVLMIEELALYYFSGAFNYKNVIKNIIIGIVLSTLILTLSKWNI